MNALLSLVESIGVLIVGLVARFGLLLLVLAVVAIVFFIGLAIVRGSGALRRRLLGLSTVEGLTWKRGFYYAPGHTWVQWRSGNVVRVGLDDLAQRLLPGVTSVRLPQPGAVLEEGQMVSDIECGDKRAAIPTPVAGKVLAINPAVRRDPSLVHRDPYARGWLFTMEAANTRYVRLEYGLSARGWFGREAQQLARFLETELGVAAADGGELVAPGASLLREEQWQALTSRFLKSPATAELA